MSTFGTMTTIERINQIGPGELSSGLVFRASRKQCFPGVPFFAWGPALQTELQVNDHGLTATGDLGGVQQGTLYLSWSRVQELHFAPSGKGEIGGLYAREGAWCSRCLLPRLTEAQTDDVIAAIAVRYPALAHSPGEGVAYSPGFTVSHQPHVAKGWKPRLNPAIHPPR